MLSHCFKVGKKWHPILLCTNQSFCMYRDLQRNARFISSPNTIFIVYVVQIFNVIQRQFIVGHTHSPVSLHPSIYFLHPLRVKGAFTDNVINFGFYQQSSLNFTLAQTCLHSVVTGSGYHSVGIGKVFIQGNMKIQSSDQTHAPAFTGRCSFTINRNVILYHWRIMHWILS